LLVYDCAFAQTLDREELRVIALPEAQLNADLNNAFLDQNQLLDFLATCGNEVPS
jgi:hypothetical protein